MSKPTKTTAKKTTSQKSAKKTAQKLVVNENIKAGGISDTIASWFSGDSVEDYAEYLHSISDSDALNRSGFIEYQRS